MSTTKLNYERTATVAPMRNMKQSVLKIDLKDQANKLNAGGNGLSFGKGDLFEILGFVPVEYTSEADVKGTSIKKGNKFQAIEMDLQLKRTRGTDTDQFKNTSIRKFLEEWPSAERISTMNFVDDANKTALQEFLDRNASYTGPKFVQNIGAYGFIQDMQKLAWNEDGEGNNTIEVLDTVRFSYTVPNANAAEGENPVYTFSVNLYTFGVNS